MNLSQWMTVRRTIPLSLLVYVTPNEKNPPNANYNPQNGFFIAGSEDGTVCKYSLEDNKLQDIIVRTSLPVRDIALSPDGNWVAVASE